MNLERIYKALMRREKRISIDIDYMSPRKLIQTYIKAVQLFPENQIEIYLSPSKTGFHIKIQGDFTLLENLLYRALLWDDPYRIAFALMKLAMSEGEETFIDLVFREKSGGKEERIDIKKLLGEKLENLIKRILSGERGKEVDEEVERLADELDKKIKRDVPPLLCITFDEEKIIDKLQDALIKYSLKKSIRWRIYPNYHPESNYILVIIARDHKDVLSYLEKEVNIRRYMKKMWTKKVEAHRIYT